MYTRFRGMPLSLVALPSLIGAQGDPKPRPMPRGVVVQAAIERYPVSGATTDEITQSS